MNETSLEIRPGLSIPLAELVLRATRSGGPGGQHVNKVSTRVSLSFDLERSPSLGAHEKTLLRERLHGRVTRDGRLRVVCGLHRSQAANRQAVLLRFAALLRRALHEDRPRRETRVPAAEKRRRVETKRRHAQVKQRRRVPAAED